MSKKLIIPALLILAVWTICFCQTPQEKSKALFDVVRGGNLKQVLTLLDSGTDVNSRDAYNCTPLIVAVKHDQLEIARVLCDRGADVSAVGDYNEINEVRGFSPLQWAAWNCNIHMAELLISKGASPGQKDKLGHTSLMIAARKDCLPVAKLLVEKGAPVNEVTDVRIGGDSALVVAVGAGNLDLADYLIKHGADLETKDQAGRSMLSLAAYRGFLAEVQYFHKKGLPIDGAIYNCLGNYVESQLILEYFIEHKGNPCLKNSSGITPLMVAALNGANIVAETLLAHGAVVNDAEEQGKTPLRFACQGYSDDEAELVVPNWPATVKLLLDKGAQVNVQDRDGITPLMETARRGSLEIIGMLLERRALMNVQDAMGWTPLMYAANANKVEVLRLLAGRGADLNVRNKNGMTALGMAKKWERLAAAYAVLKSLGAKE